jgi:hypothetical protein
MKLQAKRNIPSPSFESRSTRELSIQTIRIPCKTEIDSVHYSLLYQLLFDAGVYVLIFILSLCLLLINLQEIFHTTGGDDDDDDDDEEGALYSPLSCDLCQKMFTTPAEWVRHIEAHPENQQQQQQRGRRAGRQSRVIFGVS